MTTKQAIGELNKLITELTRQEDCALDDDSSAGQEWLHEIELRLEALAMSKRALIEREGNA